MIAGALALALIAAGPPPDLAAFGPAPAAADLAERVDRLDERVARLEAAIGGVAELRKAGESLTAALDHLAARVETLEGWKPAKVATPPAAGRPADRRGYRLYYHPSKGYYYVKQAARAATRAVAR